MQDASSARIAVDAVPVFNVRPTLRITMVLMGYLPLLHVSAALALALLPALGVLPPWTALLALAALYLLPPLVVRLVLILRPLPEGRFPMDSAAFLVWWFTAQWQVVFCRMPLLEEGLRLVPGLYSAWLRLWGARVGRFVYWAPGLRVLDRPMLKIGDRVVFGADVHLSPHVIARGPSGRTEIALAPIRIGNDALIGGWSRLPAGVDIGPCEQTPAWRPLAPFTHFRDGKAVRTERWNKEDGK